MREDLSYLKGLFQSLGLGLLVVGPDRRIVLANALARELLGFRRDVELEGPLFHRRIRSRELVALLNRALAKNLKIAPREIGMPLPQERILIVSVAPLQDIGGGEGVIVALRDRTEKRVLDREATRVERAATVEGLLSWVAHEVRNPLNSLSIHLELLTEEMTARLNAGSREPLRLIDILKEEVTRLEETMREFLAVHRPSRLRLRATDLAGTVEKVVTFFLPEAQRKRVRLLLRRGKTLARVRLDAPKFRHVLVNLLLNAMEAVPEGGTIEVRLRRRGEGLFLDVKDTGRGIPARALPKVFDYFYTTREEGTGLGLAISKKIVEEHGGRIRVRSSPGVGTTVTVRLPALEG